MNNTTHTSRSTSARPAIRLSEARVVHRPAVTTWAFVADYGNDPSWRHGVITMAPSSPGVVEVGVTTGEDLRFAGRTHHNDGRVTAVVPERSFRWETTSGVTARGSRTVEPLDDGRSRVELHLEVEPTGADRLLAPLFRRLLARQLAGDADRLAEVLEGAGDARVQAARP